MTDTPPLEPTPPTRRRVFGRGSYGESVRITEILRKESVGGTVLVPHALWKGRVANPAARDDVSVAFRTLLQEVSRSKAVTSALSPVGDGLLQLVKRGR